VESLNYNMMKMGTVIEAGTVATVATKPVIVTTIINPSRWRPCRVEWVGHKTATGRHDQQFKTPVYRGCQPVSRKLKSDFRGLGDVRTASRTDSPPLATNHGKIEGCAILRARNWGKGSSSAPVKSYRGLVPAPDFEE